MYEVRLAKTADVPAMLAIYRPYVEETTISFEYDAPTAEQFMARMMNFMAKYPVFVYERGGEVCGYAYAAPAFERVAYAWSVDLSVYVRKDLRGQGMGRALERAVSVFLKALGYRKVYALVAEGNDASIAFHEAVGYRRVAFFPEQGYKRGRWLGVLWLEKELNGAACAEDFPRTMGELLPDELYTLLCEANA